MKAFDDLKRLLSEGRIERREFIKRSTALGVATAIPSIVLTEEARASEPKRGGRFRMAVRGGATSDSLAGGSLFPSPLTLTTRSEQTPSAPPSPHGTETEPPNTSPVSWRTGCPASAVTSPPGYSSGIRNSGGAAAQRTALSDSTGAS